VGGGYGNSASGDTTTVGGGEGNIASDFYATVGGGYGNSASQQNATVSGGIQNTASGLSATAGGGYYNTASGDFATVGGGHTNIASGYVATVGGGWNNIASGSWPAVVSGGMDNQATNEFATVPGGDNNIAGGVGSFAAGMNAQAIKNGAFVWSDGTANTTSTVNNQFMARASGGFIFYTGSGSSAYAQLAAGATTWTAVSDRNAKKNFQPVDTVAVVDKLAAIPIQQWNYKWENDTDVPNIGPMAQDFKQAFYPGRDDKGISTLEFDGVELAAIQGLNQKVEEKAAKIQEQAAEIQSLKQDMAELKKLVQTIAEKK
jgi:hypothetical protein